MISTKLYDVVTLYDCMQDPATLAWLVHASVPLPGEIPSGRYPAPHEIRQVIEAVPGIRSDYLVSGTVWQVTVTSRSDVAWMNLAIKGYTGDPERPHQFMFTAGWDEMILLITSQLAKRCGPLVLLHDSGAPPQVVM